MTQTEINQVVEAMQLTPKYKNILRKCLNGDNEEVKNAIKKLNDADIELNTKLTELANKVNNLKTDVFAVVNSLPTENIENKIYCVKDTTDGGANNKFIEYIYIETTKSWEKVGEFKAEPDLSGYAKLNSNNDFTGDINAKSIKSTYMAFLNETYIAQIRKHKGTNCFLQIPLNAPASELALRSPHITYSTDGQTVDVGSTEDFVFTLEDGSTVTKSIRVISTTSQAGA